MVLLLPIGLGDLPTNLSRSKSYGTISDESAKRKSVFLLFFLNPFSGIPDATDLITIFARERSITIIASDSKAILVRPNKLFFETHEPTEIG